jgi:hypothetical protein
MALVDQDFSIEKGTSFILEFQLTKDDGNPLPLTSQTGYNQYAIGDFSFRTRFCKTKYLPCASYTLSGTKVLQIGEETTGKTADGFYILAAKPGYARMVLSPSTTSSLKFGRYFYDIEVVNGNAGRHEVTKVLGGTITFEKDSTNGGATN